MGTLDRISPGKGLTVPAANMYKILLCLLLFVPALLAVKKEKIPNPPQAVDGDDDDSGSGEECENKDVTCDQWASAGYCTHEVYKDYMEENCRKACQLCGGEGDCVDENYHCSAWARMGYCHGYYSGYMKKHCKKSCNVCGGGGGGGGNCQDKNRYCGQWARYGYCYYNQYVQQNCKKSCGTC